MRNMHSKEKSTKSSNDIEFHATKRERLDKGWSTFDIGRDTTKEANVSGVTIFFCFLVPSIRLSLFTFNIYTVVR